MSVFTLSFKESTAIPLSLNFSSVAFILYALSPNTDRLATYTILPLSKTSGRTDKTILRLSFSDRIIFLLTFCANASLCSSSVIFIVKFVYPIVLIMFFLLLKFISFTLLLFNACFVDRKQTLIYP